MLFRKSAILLYLIGFLLLLCGCRTVPGEESSSERKEPEIPAYTVVYRADDGGHILGEQIQTILSGKCGSTVTAIPEEGYVFTEWSDGVTTPARADLPTHDLDLTASFQKMVTVSFRCEPTTAGSLQGDALQSVKQGAKTAPITAVPNPGYRFAGWSNGESTDTISSLIADTDTEYFALFEEIPFVADLRIATDDGKSVSSRNTYKSAAIGIDTDIAEYCLDDISCQIRGHGNSSWNYFHYSKPSYRLKLDEKCSLLGIGNKPGKDYVLLCNHADATMLRNWAALRFASLLEIPYVPECRYVNLYINGNYRGLYLLCEKIKTGGSRVDIDDSGEEEDTGYLLELDQRAPDEDDPWFTLAGTDCPIAIKSDAANDAQRAYIKKYLADLMNAIGSEDREAVAALADIPSFVNMFILEEFTMDRDVGFASFYMVKEKGGLLFCACPWDFDLSLGNDSMFRYPEYLVTSSGRSNPIFKALWKNNWFRADVAARLTEASAVFEQLLDETSAELEFLEPYNQMDDDRWGIYGERLLFEPDKVCYSLHNYKEHGDYLLGWMKDRFSWLDEAFGKYR